ncbi:hypothetical protein BD324DRAFT_640872 [Kockovaella imperatae]|uniref:Citrate transporter-like domain-containing protein n=1 Tax=Kockovaella imperatae TaxID=4999 RepID=A0A1Y1UNR8_9TREE|nr:hypothetical protein BD324DRAFT_640872 [Kockovaella imperatae]ORX39642.1 hypothetical protein BD324DRAFT_640872 [Kockovaella imperatae]
MPGRIYSTLKAVMAKRQVITNLDGSSRNIDGWSIATLIIFLIVNILVIFPLRIPLPFFVSRACEKLLILVGLRARPAQQPKSTDASPPSPPASTDDSDQEARQEVAENQKSKPSTNRPQRWHLTIGLNTAPVIGVLLLLATTCIPGKVVRSGIVGSDHVKPYDILTLFICFAYISVSLDSTGLLRYLAFMVASRASSSGTLLYNSFYCFISIVGLLVGNDPVTLSATPFLVYFTNHAKIDPTAYLFSIFQVSNLVSALLVSSNPTNLVLTSAFGISFLSYSAWTALPTVAAMVVLFPLLRYFQFRKDKWIPRKLSPPQVDAKQALKDPWGGIFGAALFLVTIVLLVGLSAGGKLEGVEGVWTVTAPAALIMLSRDIVHDYRKTRPERKPARKTAITEKKVEERVRIDSERGSPTLSPQETDDGDVGQVREELIATALEKKIKQAEDSPQPSRPGSAGAAHAQKPETHEVATLKNDEEDKSKLAAAPTPRATTPPVESSADRDSSPELSTEKTAKKEAANDDEFKAPLLRPITSRIPVVSGTISRLPFSLLPFAFSMFILVEALQHTGWIRVFGKWWAAWAEVGGVAGCVFMMGLISVLGCNVFGTNIGATIMLSRILQQWVATEGNVSQRVLYGSVFALAVGSNFGAYSFVFSASLAGLLWRNILSQKGIHVKTREFQRWNWLPLVVTMIVGCLVVAGEVCVMYKA